MLSETLAVIHDASRGSPKRGSGKRQIASSQLPYCITSRE